MRHLPPSYTRTATLLPYRTLIRSIVPATRNKFAGRATIDNRGTSELGPVRMQLAVDFNGVIGPNDALTVQGTVTPLQPRELQVGFVRYVLQVGTAGTELATYASYGRTHSGGYWRAFDSKGGRDRKSTRQNSSP